jgi:hypothetical protein
MKLIKYFLVLVISSLIFSTLALSVQAQTPTPLNFKPEISIPNSDFDKTKSIDVGAYTETKKDGIVIGKMSSDLLSKYIKALYDYGLAIVGILATVVLMGGGLLWLTSRGDSGQVTKAKEMIIGSITGMVILFSAWIILNTVNPALLEFKKIETVVVAKMEFGCCDKAKESGKAEMTYKKYCSGNLYTNKRLTERNKCEEEGCCIITGKGKEKADFCGITTDIDCKAMAKQQALMTNNQYTYTIESNTCAISPKCDESITASCIGVKNATPGPTKLFDTDYTGQTYNIPYRPFWCYNEKFYLDNYAKVGEPCGNDPNSKCQSGSNAYRCAGDLSFLNARICGGLDACCKFNDNGTMKYQSWTN